jgi:hypothetical protein
MSSNKSVRVLVAAALVAALFLAVPAAALDGRGTPLGLMERLAAWFVETFSDDLAGGANPATTTDTQSPTVRTTDDDPEGCRDYTGCVDPNG